MAAVAVFQFVYLGAPSFGKQLVSHTDAEDGQFLVLHCLADMLHGSIAGIGVARAVGDEQPVELHPSIIIVPGNANHFHVTFQQAADDVMLDAAIHKEHFLLTGSFVVTDNLLAANFIHIIHIGIRGLRHFIRFIIKGDTSHHHPMLAKHLCQFAGIDARDARNLFAFQPVTETFHRIPMAIIFTIIAYNNGFGMDMLALHKSGKPIRFESKRRHTVIAHQRIGERHQLSGIRRVGQAFGITRHGCVEDHLSRYRFFKAERLAVEAAPVVED